MPILARYLLKAATGPFLFALGVLTGLLMVNTVARRIEDLAGKGLPASVIGEVFLLSLPHVLALTLPMAVLVAVLFAFSALAADNEITALKASGVNLARLSVPLMVAAIGLAGVMLWFNDQLLPDTNHRLKTLLIDVSRKSPTLQLEERAINPISSGDYRSKYYLQAAEIDPATNQLLDVIIWDMSDPGELRTIYADSGRMAFNQERTDLFLTLFDGHIHDVQDAEPGRFQRVFFERQVIRMQGVGDMLERSTDTSRGEREMGFALLGQEADRRRLELHEIRAEAGRLAAAALDLTLAGDAGAPTGAEVRRASDDAAAGAQGPPLRVPGRLPAAQ
ncbi:MAG TPA: LptF/LptG family permease, partial [Longimicrobiales bacterium]|nr:LptF/LptG family permease [Longimicrobiales bacterium]